MNQSEPFVVASRLHYGIRSNAPIWPSDPFAASAHPHQYKSTVLFGNFFGLLSCFSLVLIRWTSITTIHTTMTLHPLTHLTFPSNRLRGTLLSTDPLHRLNSQTHLPRAFNTNHFQRETTTTLVNLYNPNIGLHLILIRQRTNTVKPTVTIGMIPFN